jgi:hypothetical protein
MILDAAANGQSSIPGDIGVDDWTAEISSLLSSTDDNIAPDDVAAEDIVDRTFPILSEDALYGLPGKIVRAIEPHTEADNVALLVQLLSGFGSLIGKSAYFRVGGDYHFTKIFVALVGATASGRKGTSWSAIRSLLILVDPNFHYAVQNGLSTGEGLIYHVRDPQTVSKPIKLQGGAIDGYQDEVVDEGVKEKRAFIIEPEFGRVLKVMSREGNTLSSVIRQAWDTDHLSVMTKNPIKASDAHITVVGHITEAELLRSLRETETANGFANRFAWVCVRRSKYLPDGGNLSESDLVRLSHPLGKAVEHARTIGELKRDPAAGDLWRAVYRRLSDGYGGLLGSVTSRATAQVMRLACVYALLETSTAIRLEHLQAALALWQYSEDSAKYIFGMSTGDKLAEDVYLAIEGHHDGLAKTGIHGHFSRNKTAKGINDALELLQQLGRIEKVLERPAGKKGRASEVYRVVRDELNEVNEEIESDTLLSGINSFNSFNSLPEENSR